MAKQAWTVGQTVNVGGRTLLVTGHLPPRQKGEAGVWCLQTGDGSKAYEWVPFRGLKLVRGDLVRPARAAKRRQQAVAKRVARAVAQAPAASMVRSGGLFRRLLAHFGKRVKDPSNATITRAPRAAIGQQAGPS